MKVLGIDYGKAKVGLALADTVSQLAEPLRVIRYSSREQLFSSLAGVFRDEEIEQIVVGVSQGFLADESREFGTYISGLYKVPVAFQDETLTSHDAQEFSIAAGIKRKKRQALEDAYSAAIILQSWLDDKA